MEDDELLHDGKKNLAEMPCINDGFEENPILGKAQIEPTGKRRPIINALILSLAYFFTYTGFWTLSNLESTMNAEQGIGVSSQAVIYLCSMMSCFFPELLIEKFGTKSTYVISLLLSTPYVAANFKLRWDTMIVSSVLFGLASGPMNAALSSYLDEMSIRYSSLTNENQENVEAYFFGLFLFFVEFTQVAGNAASYFILLQGHERPPGNFSVQTHCGMHFNQNEEGINTNLDPPTDRDRYIVSEIFLLLSILGVVVALLLDPLGNDVKEVKGCRSIAKKVISSVGHLKNPHQLLLLPLTIYIGMESSFYSADFNQAFIACSWGVHHVGFVTICFGVCGALMAIIVGPVVKCISQMSVIVLAAIINVITCALLFVWQPSPDSPVEYFAFAGVWGMTDAIWWSQVAALYGLMFPNDREAAFSNFFFWSFLGYFLSYSYANYFTVAVKINIMLVFLIVGITLYVVGQVKIKCCTSRNTYVAIGDSE